MRVIAGSQNVTSYFYIVGDASHASPGDPVTGLLFSDIETGGSASYARAGAAAGAHTDGGFVLLDDTNMPGVYRVDWPDAAFAVGASEVILQLVIAAAKNAVASPIKVELADPVAEVFATETVGATGNLTTAAHVPNWTFGDTEIVDDVIAIKDVSQDEWFIRKVLSWTNSTKIVTFAALPLAVEASVDLVTRLGGTMSTIALEATVDAVQTDLDNGTDGLGAIKTAVDAIPTTAMRGTDNVVLAGPTKAEMDTAHALLATQADVGTEISDYFGAQIDSDINDVSASASVMTVTADQSTKILVGVMRLTSGAIAGEARLVHWTGTTIETLDPDSIPAGLGEGGPFSAAPADNVTFTFIPLS
jgi:hypothetical protein